MKRVLVTATAVAPSVVLNPLPAHAAGGWVDGSLTVARATAGNNRTFGYGQYFNPTVVP